MAEVWSQLGTLRSKRQGCLDDAQQIRLSCAQDHQKETLVECEECYGKLIEGLRSRYLDSSDPEWFTERESFLQELKTLFSAAKQREVDPRDIETRIQAEKRKWYQENVGDIANRLIVDDTASRNDILDKLYEQNLALEDLVSEVGKVVARVAPPPPDVGALVDKLASQPHAENTREADMDAFFLGGTPSGEDGAGAGDENNKTTPRTQAGNQPYLDLLQSGMSMKQIVLRIMEQHQASTGTRLQREKLTRRLDELRRGRTAHELQKTKKKTKSRGSAAVESAVPKELYDLPPCAVCSTAPDTADFLSCSLCQVLVGLGVRGKPTVYCSNECYERGHGPHREQAHPCDNGEHCILLRDEDVDMDADTYLCRECVGSLETPSVFCSARCAGINFQAHREQVHLPLRKKLGSVVDDSNKLVYDDEAQSKYHAADIMEYLVPLAEALRAFEKNNGISVSIV